MKVSFKNPAVEYVSLHRIENGKVFKRKGKTPLFLKLASDGNRVISYNLNINTIEYFVDSEQVQPFNNVELVIYTEGDN